MKNSLYFKQLKPTTVTVLGVFLLIILGMVMFTNSGTLDQYIVLSGLSIVVLGYSISYEITKDFKNKKHYKLFGQTLFRQKLQCIYPEYITVFSASFKQGAEWGSVAALGKERGERLFVIRLFKGNRHFTIFKTKSLEKATTMAVELCELLSVELRGNK